MSRILAPVVLALLTSNALAAPLEPADLVRLHEAQISDQALRDMVGREGLAAPLDTEAVLELRHAGLSSEFVSWLLGEPSSDAADAIRQRVEDGVLVVSGGSPATEPPAAETMSEPEFEPAPLAAPVVTVLMAPSQSVVVPVAVETARDSWESARVARIPARFGDPDSAFGRTVVLPPSIAACRPLATAEVVTPQPTPRTVPIRTSRGTLYLPN